MSNSTRDPEEMKKAFHELASFRVVVIGFCVAAIVSAIAMGCKSEGAGLHSGFSFSPDGYKELMRIYKFPLYLVSLAFVFGIVISRFHRSAQLAHTIEVAELKEDWDRRIKHEEHFLSHVNGLKDLSIANASGKRMWYVGIDGNHALYCRFFPKNKLRIESYQVDHEQWRKQVQSTLTSIEYVFSGEWEPSGEFKTPYDAVQNLLANLLDCNIYTMANVGTAIEGKQTWKPSSEREQYLVINCVLKLLAQITIYLSENTWPDRHRIYWENIHKTCVVLVSRVPGEAQEKALY